MADTLVIIPCGKKTVWEDAKFPPSSVPIFAAYIDDTFKLEVAFADEIGADFLILTKGIGFLDGHESLSQEMSLSKRNLRKLFLTDRLCDQVNKYNFYQYRRIIGLGNKNYHKTVNEAFEYLKLKIDKPYEGLPKNQYLKKLRRRVEEEIIISAGDWYDDLSKDSYSIDKDGTMTFLKNCWHVPRVGNEASCWIEGPGPTDIEIELAQFRTLERRQILFDLPLNYGACDQLNQVTRVFLGKKILIRMDGDFWEDPYPFEAQLIGIKLKKDQEGFTQCHMCLTDIKNRDTHLGSEHGMYDGSSDFPKDSDGSYLLNLSMVYELKFA